jgi:hypothetical protein
MEGRMSIGSPSLLLAARVLLVLLAAGATVTAFVVSHRAESVSPALSGVSYVCPMHAEVVAAAPGDCPICRMALEPVTQAAKASAPAHHHPAAEPEPEQAAAEPISSEFRAFDAVSRTKPFALSLEMRASGSVSADGTGTALFYRDEAELLQPGEEGLFLPATRRPSAPLGIKVRVGNDAAVDWDARTKLVSFHADEGQLSAGEVGSVKFATRQRKGLVVRATAILASPEGNYVLVVSNDRRTMTPRRIQIGSIIYGYAAVTSGLVEDENVAARHTSVLAAELRQKGRIAL